MEWVDFVICGQKDIHSTDIGSCQLFGCQYHEVTLAINENGQVFLSSNEDTIDLQFLQAIDQVLVSCRQDPEACRFYLRSVSNQVYEWNMNKNEKHSRKRMKLDSSSMDVTQEEYNLIAENIYRIMPSDQPGVLLFSGLQVQHYDPETNRISDVSNFSPNDVNITCHQYFKRLDSGFDSFLSLGPIKYGMVYGTKEGYVYCRDFENDPVEDTQISIFEGLEKVKHVELLCIPAFSKDLNTLVAVGDRGTILVYFRASNDSMESNVSFKQFNIQGPIHSIEKAHKDLIYIVASGIGRISMIKFNFTTDNVEIETTYMKSNPYIFKRLRMCGASNYSFDALSGNGIMMNIQFNPTPVSVANNPNDISALIKDTLAELEFSESSVRSLENKEQDLNQKLSSTNRTLYALRSINSKRKLGICNSLESTGFEFTMCPTTRPESIANCSLHPTSYLRVCIKTSRFLELEDWDLSLDLFPYNRQSSKSSLGETKTVPVMGFEIHFDNGIERYSFWERDIEIDLECLTLPLEVSATLIMSAEKEKLPLRFPVSKMIVDDLHYAVPCGPDFITSIERRGLEEVSNRLINSYNRQKLNDKSGKHPFARLMKSKLSEKETPLKYLFNHRNVHIRCLIDSNISDESYRSILPSILSEGRTLADITSILTSAEQALFTLAAYPGCPIIVKLSRVSPTIIDLSIQCIYPPALFKTEAAILARLYDNFIQPLPSSDSDLMDTNEEEDRRAFRKKLKLLWKSFNDLQEKYEIPEDQMDIDDGNDNDNSLLLDELKKAVDLILGIHNEAPIGYLEL